TMLAEFTRKSDGTEAARQRQTTLEDQLFPLLLEERKLLQTYGPQHAEVLAIRKRIEVARRLLLLPPTAWRGEADEPVATRGKTAEDAIELHVQVLKQRLSHIKISEELLASVFETEQAEARALAAYEIQNDSFQTGIRLNQQLYEALVKRLGEVNVIKSVGGY